MAVGANPYSWSPANTFLFSSSSLMISHFGRSDGQPGANRPALKGGLLLVGSVRSFGSHGSLGSYGSLGSFGSHGSLGSLKSLGSLWFHE